MLFAKRLLQVQMGLSYQQCLVFYFVRILLCLIKSNDNWNLFCPFLFWISCCSGASFLFCSSLITGFLHAQLGSCAP